MGVFLTAKQSLKSSSTCIRFKNLMRRQAQRETGTAKEKVRQEAQFLWHHYVSQLPVPVCDARYWQSRQRLTPSEGTSLTRHTQCCTSQGTFTLASHLRPHLLSLPQLSSNPVNLPHIVLNQLQTLLRKTACSLPAALFTFFSSLLSFCPTMNGWRSFPISLHVQYLNIYIYLLNSMTLLTQLLLLTHCKSDKK